MRIAFKVSIHYRGSTLNLSPASNGSKIIPKKKHLSLITFFLTLVWQFIFRIRLLTNRSFMHFRDGNEKQLYTRLFVGQELCILKEITRKTEERKERASK